jgi:hypothetical protein
VVKVTTEEWLVVIRFLLGVLEVEVEQVLLGEQGVLVVEAAEVLVLLIQLQDHLYITQVVAEVHHCLLVFREAEVEVVVGMEELSLHLSALLQVMRIQVEEVGVPRWVV